MATDYGTDVYCIEDLDPAFSLVRGKRVVSQACLRRLGTPRGGLFYDPEYGFDLRQFANSSFGEAESFQVSSGIQSELVKDERVRSCTAQATFDADLEKLSVIIDVVSENGPFRLILAVSAVTIEVLASP